MADEFCNDECLFRAVLPAGMYWKEDGTVSSAAFKDKNGLSTDRDRGREKETCVECMKARPDLNGSIISFKVGECWLQNIFVKYDPIDSNIYHSLVIRNEQEYYLTKSQARYLSTVAVVEYRPELASIA